MFFSGGVDSTYSLLRRTALENKEQDFLTVHGMDYKYDDHDRFERAKDKTTQLTQAYGSRYFVTTDAYNAYRKFKIEGQISFIFLLTSIGFMFYKKYTKLVLASDRPSHQQFFPFPYGSNFITNKLFDSGYSRLESHGDDATRAEKMVLIASNLSALRALSCCKNYQMRPENCGVCGKCVRTKAGFLAANGSIPKGVFREERIDKRILNQNLAANSGIDFLYLKDIITVAKRKANLELLLPMAERMENICHQERQMRLKRQRQPLCRRGLKFLARVKNKIKQTVRAIYPR